MINFNILLHFLVIQYMPDLTIGSKVFQIMFEFFLPKKSLQNWQKKSIFSGAIGDHILGFWTQCKKSLGALVCETLFLDDPLPTMKLMTITTQITSMPPPLTTTTPTRTSVMASLLTPTSQWPCSNWRGKTWFSSKVCKANANTAIDPNGPTTMTPMQDCTIHIG